MSYYDQIFMHVLKNISTIAKLEGMKKKVTKLAKQLNKQSSDGDSPELGSELPSASVLLSGEAWS